MAAALVCAVLASHLPARAQTLPLKSPEAPSLTSNRPGIAESEALLIPRAFQLESGFTIARFSDGDVRHRVVDLPEATLRFGLTPRVELFANLTNLLWDRTSQGSVSTSDNTGASDLSLNAKLGWLSEGADPLTVSIAAGVSLPAGSDAFSSGGYDPSLRVLWSRSLPAEFGVSGNLDIASVTSGGDRLTVGAASVGLGRPLTATSSWFVELFGDVVDGDAEWQFDGGVAILPANDFQIDLSAGRTLRSGPSAWFIAAGVTLRHRQ